MDGAYPPASPSTRPLRSTFREPQVLSTRLRRYIFSPHSFSTLQQSPRSRGENQFPQSVASRRTRSAFPSLQVFGGEGQPLQNHPQLPRRKLHRRPLRPFRLRHPLRPHRHLLRPLRKRHPQTRRWERGDTRLDLRTRLAGLLQTCPRPLALHMHEQTLQT